MSARATSPLRVLVVEDEPLFAELLEACLSDLRYEVLGPASSAAAALALVRDGNARPDVALLDIYLGERSLDGIELARRLLAERPLPVIFLTSQADTASFERARQVCPAAYLVKPADPATIQRAIELAVSNFARASSAGPGTADGSLYATPGGAALLPGAIFLKEDGLLVKVVLHDIAWIEAEGKYCRVALSGGRVVQVRQPLRDIIQHLSSEYFVQIQRSYLINAEHIERIDPVRNMVQVAGNILPIGLMYRDHLLERLRLI